MTKSSPQNESHAESFAIWKQGKLVSFLDIMLGGNVLGPYLLTHHPLCEHFEDHVFNIRGIKVCRGCTMLYSGMIISIILLLIGSALSGIFVPNFVAFWYADVMTLFIYEIGAVILLYLLVVPAVGISLTDLPRPIKDAARFVLGGTMALSLLIILSPFYSTIFLRIWVLLNFIVFWFSMSYYRKKRNDKQCNECTDKREDGCPGYDLLDDRKKVISRGKVFRDAFAETDDSFLFQDEAKINSDSK